MGQTLRNTWNHSLTPKYECVGYLLTATDFYYTRIHERERERESFTQNVIFSVTYYLDLRNAIIVYRASHFLPTMVELVVWTL